jgi:heptosyltransferase-2
MNRAIRAPLGLPARCRVVVRATNWLGDGVMSMPALRQLRDALPHAHLAVAAPPAVSDLYRQPGIDEVIPWTSGRGRTDVIGRWRCAERIRALRFDAAILLQNAFEAALVMWMAGVPLRIGYDVKGRGWLLTHSVPVPAATAGPTHQSLYYLALLQRAGITATMPEPVRPTLAPFAVDPGNSALPNEGPWIGVAPGAANGAAKRWPPERFAESSAMAAQALGARVVLLGSPADREIGARVANALRAMGTEAIDLSGRTTVGSLMAVVASCEAVLTNDSGAMHMADALGIPTVAVFGPTSEDATGPTGPWSAVVRHSVDCSPCLLHECPVDHRCMREVASARVAEALIRVVTESWQARRLQS